MCSHKCGTCFHIHYSVLYFSICFRFCADLHFCVFDLGIGAKWKQSRRCKKNVRFFSLIQKQKHHMPVKIQNIFRQILIANGLKNDSSMCISLALCRTKMKLQKMWLVRLSRYMCKNQIQKIVFSSTVSSCMQNEKVYIDFL